MADDENSMIKQIEEGLKRCYIRNKMEYDEDEGFKFKCEENGFEEDEAIMEEINAPLAESQMADPDFLEGLCPWIPEDDEENRVQLIFEILKQCAEDKEAFSSNVKPIEVQANTFEVTSSEIEKAKNQAKEYAASVYGTGFENDESLCRMLAISNKTNNPLYLQYLVDMFMRESLYHNFKNRDKDNKAVGQPFGGALWVKTNHHLKALTNLDVKTVVNKQQSSASDLAKAAVTSYLHRVAPKLLFQPANKLPYSLKDVCEYVQATISFVQDQATKPYASCPFQYDSVFLFEKFTSEMDDGAEEEEDDDVEDDEDPDNGGSEGTTKSKIPPIKETLAANNMPFESVKWDKADISKQRVLGGAFENMKGKSKNKTFPRFNRFCSVLDLRANLGNGSGGDDKGKDDEKKEDSDEHNLFVFEAEEKSKMIHKPVMALNFFHNSKTNIIPDPNASADEPDIDQNDEPTLASGTLGPQIMLSFHVEAADNMRCYFFINGQCARFLPEDLKLMLPLFFEPTVENVEYKDSEELDRMIKELDGKFKGMQVIETLDTTFVISDVCGLRNNDDIQTKVSAHF